MNESPENDDDPSIRRLLAEANVEESRELLEGLRRLRSYRPGPAPVPTGKLAALLADPAVPPRPKRHRGLILSFALAGAMAAGTTGVAASNGLFPGGEPFFAAVPEQVVPEQAAAELVPEPAEAPETDDTPETDAAAGLGVDPAAPGPVVFPAEPERVTVVEPSSSVDEGEGGETPPPAGLDSPAGPDSAAEAVPHRAGSPEKGQDEQGEDAREYGRSKAGRPGSGAAANPANEGSRRDGNHHRAGNDDGNGEHGGSSGGTGRSRP